MPVIVKMPTWKAACVAESVYEALGRDEITVEQAQHRLETINEQAGTNFGTSSVALLEAAKRWEANQVEDALTREGEGETSVEFESSDADYEAS